MKTIAIIPARYGSTRFPGKPLVEIQGKTMIQRTVEQVQQVAGIHTIVVATDDIRIFDHVHAFGGRAVMTDPALPSGTDRCAAALSQLPESYDAVLNVQGDEPFVSPVLLAEVCDVLATGAAIATAVKQITDASQITNPNVVKAVISTVGRALYFSRFAIPYQRDTPPEVWHEAATYYKHIGVYGFQVQVLRELVKLPVSGLENAEKLEQLRWLEAGYAIEVAITKHESVGVDTPADLEKFR